MRWRRAVAPLLSSLFLFLGIACSGSSEDPAAGQVATPAPGSPGVVGGEEGSGDGRSGKKARRPRATQEPSGRGAGPGSSPSGSGPDSHRPGPGPALAVAFRSDPSGDTDRDGDPPAYTDIRRALLQGRGRTLRLTLRVDGPIDETLPEGTDMTVNFRLDLRGDDDYQIYAVGGREGWRADPANSGRFPGRFLISGDRFVFELPWSALGGPARLRWEAETAWTRTPSGLLAQTEFAFDRVPEYEAASYPE